MISFAYKNVESTTSFRAEEINNIGEIVASLYQKVNGYCWKLPRSENVTINLFADTPMSEVLEIIDKYRIPLAEKRLEGGKLTEKELINLEILDSLTDRILSGMSSEPDEPLDVKLALEYAQRISS